MNKKQIILKVIILLVVLFFFVYLTKELLPIFMSLTSEEGRNTFKVTIENLGVKGVALVIGLMCSQILIPILPGEPVEILAGMCFGPINGLIITMCGAFISTFLIIFLIKILGKKFIYSIVKKERIDKLEKSKFFKDEKKLDILFFILFFIPGTPKDILVYIGALLPINTYKFLFIATVARIPSIISSTIAGSNIVGGNWLWTVMVYAITFILAGIFIYIVNKKDKNIIKIVDELK